MNRPDPATDAARSFLGLCCALALLQFAFVAYTFPLDQLLTRAPLFNVDTAVHWYRIQAAIALAAQHLATGYDPYFAAGSLAGIVSNPAAKLPALLAVASDGLLGAARAWKLYTFAAALAAPLCVPLACRWFGMDIRQALWASLLAIVLWWASSFRVFQTIGMVSFVLAAFLSLAYTGAVVHALRGRPSWRAVLGLGAAGALGLFIHPLFPLPVALAVATWLAFHPDLLRRGGTWVLLIGVSAISLAPNLFWLYPSVAGIGHAVATGQALPTDFRIVNPRAILFNALGVWRDHYHGAKIYPPIAFLAVLALYLSRRGEERRTAWVFVIIGAIWEVYAALAAANPYLGSLTQPNRFVPVGYLFLLIPAGIAAPRLIALARASGPRTATAGARIGLLLAALAVLYAVRQVGQELSYSRIPHYGKRPPQVHPLGPYSRFTLAWLRAHTTDRARVLFETSNGRVHDNVIMTGYYAYTTHRQLIGGLYPTSHFAGFTDGWVFGKPIGSFVPAEFRRYLALYNIGWIIAYSKQSKRYLDHLPGVVRMQAFRRLQTYRVTGRHSFVSGGSGRLAEWRMNHLVLEGLSGADVMLKFHYLPGLIATPATPLRPVHVLGDPVPFIEVENPPPRLTIRMR